MRKSRISRAVATAVFAGAASFGLLSAGAGSAAAAEGGDVVQHFDSPQACQAAADQKNVNANASYYCMGSNGSDLTSG